MEIQKAAMAGTLESSDIMVTLKPGGPGINIDLDSSVAVYYRDEILGVIRHTLEEMNVGSADVSAVDHGALDCTIRARVITAVRRAQKEKTEL